MTHTLLSFGHGYSARELTKHLLPQGWRVIGTTRTSEKADELAASGVEPLIWPDSDMSAAIEAADHILISAGPDKGGDPTLNLLRDQITRKSSKFMWAGYLSTTGVYGDFDGAWVDEMTPLNPTTKRGQLRKAAEEDWASIAGLPLHTFRLAGIYGPGRGPFAKVRNGTARRVIKEGQVFSRIHVEDIAQILWASIQRPNSGTAYNVCDDDPAPPQDVIAYAATLLGMQVPPATAFEDAEFTPMARSFYAENKKVRNDRIKTELGVELIHPTYREGLQSLLNQMA
ncbi:MAG: SDR family oxidoreductase [Ascidiaceihabitans sp.]|jgi:nucleoside-diphosphate-sugar epimerase|tara:strand:+ start:6676 stop:7530 length:855 start_codon:yes stop_codon:yes gene_type:complete